MKILVETTEAGLTIPARFLEEVGVEPGETVEVEVARLPGPEEIQNRALRHTLWKLGDMIRVGWPQRVAGEWKVDLLSPGANELIGCLFYDARGQLIEGRSTTRATLK